MCETYVCDKTITYNPCEEGFYLYINEVDVILRVTIYISNYGKPIVKYTQLVNKILYVDFKANEYTEKATLEIEVEKLNNEGVPIPIGIGCVGQCGFQINLGTSNNRVLLNKECAEARETTFILPINDITFTLPIHNDTWQIS